MKEISIGSSKEQVYERSDYPADKIRAMVLGIDKANEKFSLGVKQMERDPWDNIKTRYKVGTAIDGSVTKLTDFGAFVEIFPGTDGLLHISEIAESRIKEVRDELNEGDQILVKVLALEGNKIKLSRKAVLKEQREKIKKEKPKVEKATRAAKGGGKG